ncbi:hypothetical protein [Clostridium sp.]|uniref:hypothetical protein n=1 Tax=Clostridium sp. TaxID=1506 RepID=UPI00263143B3|nr:hypothetical protein [Clostridium sp.]
MKLIFYKNPVISGILLNLFTMFLSIYAIKYNITPLILMIGFVGVLNRKIIDSGINMNSRKKTLIIVSFIVMSSVFFIYNEYFYYYVN